MGGPEIDAREKSIIDLHTMRGQTRTLQREELGGQADEVLILPVSESVRDFAPPCCAMSTWYEALGRLVTLLEALAKCGKSIFCSSHPRMLPLPSLWACRVPGYRLANAQLLGAV